MLISALGEVTLPYIDWEAVIAFPAIPNTSMSHFHIVIYTTVYIMSYHLYSVAWCMYVFYSVLGSSDCLHGHPKHKMIHFHPLLGINVTCIRICTRHAYRLRSIYISYSHDDPSIHGTLSVWYTYQYVIDTGNKGRIELVKDSATHTELHQYHTVHPFRAFIGQDTPRYTLQL